MVLRIFFLGCLGSLILEIVRVYELYGKLEVGIFKQTVGWWGYWLLCFGIIAVGGVAAWLADPTGAHGARFAIVSGLAGRSIVRGFAAAGAARPTNLGGEEGLTTSQRIRSSLL